MFSAIGNSLALVATPDEVPMSELTIVAAALQIQATRDAGPIWGITANVTPFTSLNDVPVGHWPIIIKAKIDQPGADGYHTDANNQPMAYVEYAPNWTLVASHEMLEMLVDPFGNRLVPGPSIDPTQIRNRVRYLLEACDPVEDASCSYTINGVMVSNFITPAYHDPANTVGGRYDFVGAVIAPRTLLKNGYISWLDTALGGWYQMTNFDVSPYRVRFLGPATATDAGLSARELVHRKSPEAQVRPVIPKQLLQDVHETRSGGAQASTAQATEFQLLMQSMHP